MADRATELAALARFADRSAAAALSANTKTAYAGDWARFAAWCERYGLTALPAEDETVRLWLTDSSLTLSEGGGWRFSPASLERALAAISRAHRDAGWSSPTGSTRVREVMAGIRRERATSPNRAKPLLLREILDLTRDADFRTWPRAIAAHRDILAIQFSFATALRRSNLVDLRCDDLRLIPGEGLEVRIRRSKTDQEGRGVTLGVPVGTEISTCVPCRVIRWWHLIEASQRGRSAVMRLIFNPGSGHHLCAEPAPTAPDGPLIRALVKDGSITARGVSGQALNEMLKRRLATAGFNAEDYSWHSLRAGFVTQARINGADTRGVRLQTQHTSDKMVDLYDREHRPLAAENAVHQLGL